MPELNMPDLNTPELSPELKKMNADIQNALTALGEGVDTKNAETVEKVQGFLTKYEDANQAYAKDLRDHKTALEAADKKAEEAEKKSGDLEGRLKDLEIGTATKGSMIHEGRKEDHPDRQSPEYKSFFEYLNKGPNNRDLDVKALRSDHNVNGGYLVPTVMDNELRKDITEVSPVRLVARVRQIPAKSVEIPRRKKLLKASYEGELQAGDDDESKYVMERATVYAHRAEVITSRDMLYFSPFDMEREIASDVVEAFAQGEGYNHIRGDGVNKPEGILNDTRIEEHVTGASGVVDFDDMAELVGKLKMGYQPMFAFNRRTLANLFQVKDSQNRPIWAPAQFGNAASIWGVPYAPQFIDLDDAQDGSGATPILYGDFGIGYEIIDATFTEAIRDEITLAGKRAVKFYFWRYNTAKVIQPEAIKKLKIQ